MGHSIRKRFAFTVGTNMFRSLLSFITGMLLARLLGRESYGNMAFLLGTFLAIQQLLDMGSSNAFFTFLSQKPRSKRFVRSFFAWIFAVQLLIPLCVIGLLFSSSWIGIIWHGEKRSLILLALTAAFMQNNLWPVIQQAGESQRQTLRVQGIGVAVVGIHMIAVFLLWQLGMLGLYAIFVAIALEYLLAAIVAQKRFQYASVSEADSIGSASAPVFRKYLSYCLPLIPYAWISFAYVFADKWLLQKYGGGTEQAYYSVGEQFAGVGLIATTSILRIFWKEIAEANYRKDHERTRMLFKRVSRLLFLVGAMITGFLIPWSGDLLQLILGAAYVGGATTLAIMLIFPVHQSMAQICGTMLYATERVSVQVITNGIFMIASVVITYVLLAPGDAGVPGLGLASKGLAIKMVLMQIISVNIIAYIIARIWHWPFDWIYQPTSLLGCAVFGWLAYFAANGLLGNSLSKIVTIGIGGVFYLMLITPFVYLFPWLAGSTRNELATEVFKVSRLIMDRIKPK